MLHEQTIEKLYATKINEMAETFKEQLEPPVMADLAFVALLVDRRWIYKADR